MDYLFLLVCFEQCWDWAAAAAAVFLLDIAWRTRVAVVYVT
jgi:hypothetical protein